MVEKCELCGATKNIQKHHTSYEPEIIQLLCVDCHKAVHNHGVGKAPGWTPLFEWLREDAEILFKEGATNKEVAKACGLSYATASHWRKKLGRGLPQWVSGVEHPNWKGKEKKKRSSKPMLGFHIDESYKDRIVEITDGLDRETMSDVIEAILKAFFIVNPGSRGKKEGQRLVLLKRKGLL